MMSASVMALARLLYEFPAHLELAAPQVPTDFTFLEEGKRGHRMERRTVGEMVRRPVIT